MKEVFQLKSTVAVLGFSVRTLSEMIEDKDLKEKITKYAKNNKNLSSPNKSVTSENKKETEAPDPFARPVKNLHSKDIKLNKEEKEEGNEK